MRFDVSQTFAAPASHVLACYASAALYEQLPEFSKISRPTLLDRSEHSGRITLRLGH